MLLHFPTTETGPPRDICSRNLSVIPQSLFVKRRKVSIQLLLTYCSHVVYGHGSPNNSPGAKAVKYGPEILQHDDQGASADAQMQPFSGPLSCIDSPDSPATRRHAQVPCEKLLPSASDGYGGLHPGTGRAPAHARNQPYAASCTSLPARSFGRRPTVAPAKGASSSLPLSYLLGWSSCVLIKSKFRLAPPHRLILLLDLDVSRTSTRLPAPQHQHVALVGLTSTCTICIRTPIPLFDFFQTIHLYHYLHDGCSEAGAPAG